MKVSSLVFALGGLLSLGQAQQQQKHQRCNNIRVRRNAASLSTQEWRNIANVLHKMDQDGWFTRFGSSHDRLFNRVHGNSCFFPFHRRYVLEFENIARTYDPNFVVPYFDATENYRNPASDPLLSEKALGHNGEGSGRCLTTGVQANYQMSYPNQHCLRRNYDNGNTINPWYSPEIISSYIQSDTDLSKFREDIEYSIHGAVHIGMGGEMDTGYAANDFSFMVHHSNIDRLWWDWQNTHNSFLMYDGPGPDGSPVSLSDTIPDDSSVPFHGALVDSVMVLGFGDVCYTYDSSPSPPQSYPSAGGNNNNNNGNNTRNTRSVMSGSSNLANRILETIGIQSALDKNAMQKLFPGLSNAITPRIAKRHLPAANKIKKRGDESANYTSCGDNIPFPPRMKPEYIKMMGYNVDRVEELHKHACEIVEVLNNSAYTSPY